MPLIEIETNRNAIVICKEDQIVEFLEAPIEETKKPEIPCNKCGKIMEDVGWIAYVADQVHISQ